MRHTEKRSESNGGPADDDAPELAQAAPAPAVARFKAPVQRPEVLDFSHILGTRAAARM